MQTFLPYADFVASASVLDQRRPGKQRVEVLQLVRALTWPDYGWKHHPATRLWRGYEEALGSCGLAVVGVWRGQGRAAQAPWGRALVAQPSFETARSRAKRSVMPLT